MSDALTEHQATELGRRIVNALRPTPPLADWVPALTGLDHDRAWRIYAQCVDTCEDGLPIATFKRHYRIDLAAEIRSRQMEPTPPPLERCPDFATGRAIAEAARRHERTATDGRDRT